MPAGSILASEALYLYTPNPNLPKSQPSTHPVTCISTSDVTGLAITEFSWFGRVQDGIIESAAHPNWKMGLYIYLCLLDTIFKY